LANSESITDAIDADPMGPAFEQAMRDEDFNALAAVVSYYRAKAAYAEGHCQGLQVAVGYLIERVRVLEARERVGEGMRAVRESVQGTKPIVEVDR
jgi:hypothetical protein